MDPVGFEPTIFSLQRRRLPARPRAQITNIAQHVVPTRGLEPPHLAAIDPKSIASANSATSAYCRWLTVDHALTSVATNKPTDLGSPSYRQRCLLYSIATQGANRGQLLLHSCCCIPVAVFLLPGRLTYPRFCHLPQQGSSSVSRTAILSVAVCGVQRVTLPCPHRCGEIQLAPDPLALLSVARSPSRGHCCPRWWALTPPFHPLPATQAGYGRESFLLRL